MEQIQEKLFLPELYKATEQSLVLKNLYLFTINHKTAPVHIREKFVIPEYHLINAINHLKKYRSIDSFLILCTCNRTEIYFTTGDLQCAINDIYCFFEEYQGLEQGLIKEYDALIKDIDVVQHIFRVASGLESLVLGESQVLSQARYAYSIAQKEKTLNSVLEQLFQKVIKTTKQVHMQTTISKNGQSISSAAVDLANKIAGPLKEKNVMVLGAGKMAKLSLEHIVRLGGSKETIVLNRSPHRVIEFAERYKITRVISFKDIYKELNEVDILICASGAPHFIIFADQFNKTRKDSNRPLFIFDISMPRNVDSEFGNLENVRLYDIDSLQNIYHKSVQNKLEDIKAVEEIIYRGANQYYELIERHSLDLLIKELKQKLEEVRISKLSKLNKKLSYTPDEVKYVTKNLINTIFHKPIKKLKSSFFAEQREKRAELLRDLFDL